MKVKIYYHHTDCGGVVYYANYLAFIEEARTEYFADRGFILKQLAQEGTLFVVARQEIDYKFPARYADVLDISTRIGRSTGVRMEFDHEMHNQDGQLIVRAKTTLVCVGADLRPKALPEHIREKLLV